MPVRSRRSPSCANTSATSSSSRASAAADAQRLIERLADQPRHLGVVREVEAGIDVGFERKLAQQRQAEGVDRRDRDVAEPLLQVAPARGVELGQTARLLQPIDDALPHLGRGLAREGDREDVIRLDAGAQQVDVALDQHARLAGAGRRLEDDVLRRDRRRCARARRRPAKRPVVELGCRGAAASVGSAAPTRLGECPRCQPDRSADSRVGGPRPPRRRTADAAQTSPT